MSAGVIHATAAEALAAEKLKIVTDAIEAAIGVSPVECVDLSEKTVIRTGRDHSGPVIRLGIGVAQIYDRLKRDDDREACLAMIKGQYDRLIEAKERAEFVTNTIKEALGGVKIMLDGNPSSENTKVIILSGYYGEFSIPGGMADIFNALSGGDREAYLAEIKRRYDRLIEAKKRAEFVVSTIRKTLGGVEITLIGKDFSKDTIVVFGRASGRGEFSIPGGIAVIFNALSGGDCEAFLAKIKSQYDQCVKVRDRDAEQLRFVTAEFKKTIGRSCLTCDESGGKATIRIVTQCESGLSIQLAISIAQIYDKLIKGDGDSRAYLANIKGQYNRLIESEKEIKFVTDTIEATLGVEITLTGDDSSKDTKVIIGRGYGGDAFFIRWKIADIFKILSGGGREALLATVREEFLKIADARKAYSLLFSGAAHAPAPASTEPK